MNVQMENGRTYESLNLEIKIEKIDLYQRTNMRIDKISSSAEHLMNEQFQNCHFWETNFGFANWKKSRNLLIFRVNSKNVEFGKF